MTPAGAGRSRVPALFAISLLTAFGPFATDLYLPALPALGADFDADPSLAQASLATSFIGIAIGQFVWGPVADRVGRRAPLLVGTAICAIASLVCALSPTIEVFIAARLVQGLAGAAGIVVGRAIVRDWYSGRDLARILARLATATAAAPIIAPVLGGAILQVADWRGTFWVLVALGAALVVAVWVWIPETLATEHRVASGEQRGAWRALRSHPTFLLMATVQAFGAAPLFVYITFIPHVIEVEHGIPDWAFALLFALNAVGVLAGVQLSAMLVKRTGSLALLIVGLGLSVAGSAQAMLAGLLNAPVWALSIGLFAVTLSMGLIMPNGLALALAPFRSGAATAAAVVGAGQFLFAGILPTAAGAAFGTSGLVMGSAMLAAALLAAIVMSFAWVRRERLAD